MLQFGQPQTKRMPQVEHATTGAEYFSLADAGAYEDEIIEGYRGDLDANAALPPLPHDVYCVRVRYADNWPQKDGQELEPLAADPARRWRKQFAKDNQLMYLTWITIKTENNTDPANDGRERTEVLTTYPNKRGMTGAQALLQGLGVDTISLNSHQAQMKALDAKLAGEGSLSGIEYDWEATVYDKNAVQLDKKTKQPIIDPATGEPKLGVELWSLRGMKKFPTDAAGEYVPEIGPKDGFSYRNAAGDVVPVMEARARNFMRRWVPVSKLNQASVLEQTLQESVQQVQQQQPQPAPQAAAATAPARQQLAQPQTTQHQQPTQQPSRPAAPAGRPAPRRVTG